jgi:hypothetical protein
MFFFMTADKKQQCYRRHRKMENIYFLCFFLWQQIKNDSVIGGIEKWRIYVFLWRTIKNDSVIGGIEKWSMFFSWRTIKNDSVTLCFFMTNDKKRQCYPLCFFSWQQIKNSVIGGIEKWRIYVFLWRTIKNNSVTPYVFFHDGIEKWQRIFFGKNEV